MAPRPEEVGGGGVRGRREGRAVTGAGGSLTGVWLLKPTFAFCWLAGCVQDEESLRLFSCKLGEYRLMLLAG